MKVEIRATLRAEGTILGHRGFGADRARAHQSLLTSGGRRDLCSARPSMDTRKPTTGGEAWRMVRRPLRLSGCARAQNRPPGSARASRSRRGQRIRRSSRRSGGHLRSARISIVGRASARHREFQHAEAAHRRDRDARVVRAESLPRCAEHRCAVVPPSDQIDTDQAAQALQPKEPSALSDRGEVGCAGRPFGVCAGTFTKIDV